VLWRLVVAEPVVVAMEVAMEVALA